MVTIIKLYILFICLNFGWGMLATGMIEANASVPLITPCDGFGEPVCTFADPCPTSGVTFDDDIHHKLCEVGIQFPDKLQFNTETESAGGLNDQRSSIDIQTQRNFTAPDGSVYSILVSDDNSTAIDSTGSEFTDIFGNFFESDVFSFLGDAQRLIGFGSSILLDTFTGGFILDVLGSEIMGVPFPSEFLLGIKILIGIAVVSYFGYLILSKPLID